MQSVRNFKNIKLIILSEYDSLIRLGIADPKSYIKRRFKDEAMTYLGTCCIGAAIKDQVEASVEEADTNDTWIDIMVCIYNWI